MTKLLNWLAILSVLTAVWLGLITKSYPIELSEAFLEVIWLCPLYILMAFACYSLAVIGYRVATFNDCEEASKELQKQIQEAKLDLRKKGLQVD